MYEFGPFRMDPQEHLLWRDGKVIPLSPKLFDTLLVLVQNSGRLLDKDEMLRRVWPDSFVEEEETSPRMSSCCGRFLRMVKRRRTSRLSRNGATGLWPV